MILRHIETGHFYSGAELNTERAENPYGQSMLIAGGEAYDPGLAHLSLEIVGATRAERTALVRAGYRLGDYHQKEA